MSTDGKWVTITGIIQFDPETKTIPSSGTEVYEFQVRDAATQRRVKATLWPENEAVYGTLSQGDFVALDGKLTVNETTNRDGDAVTYYNMSVGSIATVASSQKAERPAAAAAAPSSNDEAW